MFKRINLFGLDSITQIKSFKNVEHLNKLDKKILEEIMTEFEIDLIEDLDIKFLFPLSISDYARKHLFYIQSFVAMNNKHGYFIRQHKYDSYLLAYTYSGEGILEYKGEKHFISAGEGFLIDCSKDYKYYPASSNWYHSIIHFNGSYAKEIYDEFTLSFSNKFSTSINSSYQILLENLLHDYTTVTKYRELYVSNRLESLLVFLFKESEHRNIFTLPENIQQLIKYIENNYTAPLSLDDYSIHIGISKFHLSREFKKHTGYSPNDYLIRYRITQAKFLLESTSIPAYKIGFMVGIPNENNFLKLFKKLTNLTPTEYRNTTISPNA